MVLSGVSENPGGFMTAAGVFQLGLPVNQLGAVPKSKGPVIIRANNLSSFRIYNPAKRCELDVCLGATSNRRPTSIASLLVFFRAQLRHLTDLSNVHRTNISPALKQRSNEAIDIVFGKFDALLLALCSRLGVKDDDLSSAPLKVIVIAAIIQFTLCKLSYALLHGDLTLLVHSFNEQFATHFQTTFATDMAHSDEDLADLLKYSMLYLCICCPRCDRWGYCNLFCFSQGGYCGVFNGIRVKKAGAVSRSEGRANVEALARASTELAAWSASLQTGASSAIPDFVAYKRSQTLGSMYVFPDGAPKHYSMLDNPFLLAVHRQHEICLAPDTVEPSQRNQLSSLRSSSKQLKSARVRIAVRPPSFRFKASSVDSQGEQIPMT
jgi:hypothetical protein